MSIFTVIYEGYNKEHNRYAKCILLVRKEFCTAAYCYNFSLEFGYPICSELEIEEITEGFCAEKSDELLDSFYTARDTGCSFICFVDPMQNNLGIFNSPDLQKLISRR